jgi:hypothetical protein
MKLSQGGQKSTPKKRVTFYLNVHKAIRNKANAMKFWFCQDRAVLPGQKRLHLVIKANPLKTKIRKFTRTIYKNNLGNIFKNHFLLV